MAYQIINLKDIYNELGENNTKELLKEFSCPLNKDVEYFIKNRAIEFSKQDISRTYIVMSSYKQKNVIAGYFAITNKSTIIKKFILSKTKRKRLLRFANYDEDIKGKYDYKLTDTFMGFHCGNTPACKMCDSRAVKYQLIQHRLLEPAGSEPDFTRGTLEGDIAASDITFYRLQCNSEGELVSYVAEGEVLDVPTRSFGGIGIFAIKEMGRFYRHVLIEGNYPHHGAVMFGHYGKAFYEVVKFLGLDVKKIGYNQPAGVRYPTENPWG